MSAPARRTPTGCCDRWVDAAHDRRDEAHRTDSLEVVVKTLRVTSGSPAVGLTQDEAAPRLGAEAALLGVIDDRTPELVDSEGGRALEERDQLVVAARRGRMESLRGVV